MKRVALLIAILLITGCAGTFGGEMLGLMGATSFQNEPDGFRGLTWGQSAQNVAELQLVSEDQDGLKTYTRAGDQLTLGSAQLDSIKYLFWRDQFMEVQLTAAGSQTQGLYNVLTEKFGPPYRQAQYLDHYTWSGRAALIGLQHNRYAPRCEAWMKSRSVSDQRTVARGQKAKSEAEQGAQKDF